MATPNEDRFWAMVNKTSDCWLWTAAFYKDGYALFQRRIGPNQYRTTRGHRYAYELLVGPIPEGHDLDHSCLVKNCVNPAHLEPVTRLENTLRHFRSQTHCKNGHEWTDANTRWESLKGRAPRRQCLSCAAERKQAESPGGRHPCPFCGRPIGLDRSGALRSHVAAGQRCRGQGAMPMGESS